MPTPRYKVYTMGVSHPEGAGEMLCMKCSNCNQSWCPTDVYFYLCNSHCFGNPSVLYQSTTLVRRANHFLLGQYVTMFVFELMLQDCVEMAV